MNTVSGSVRFGGRLAYCQQNGMSSMSELTAAWIQNATLRDNVMFGQPWDEHRYWQAILNASLVSDLEILPDGDLTEVSDGNPLLMTDRRERSQLVWRSKAASQYRSSSLL
jgi:ATP-binding cassette subfamily C (CFTR/MRP) protein 1